MLIATQVLTMCQSFALAALAIPGIITIWEILALWRAAVVAIGRAPAQTPGLAEAEIPHPLPGDRDERLEALSKYVKLEKTDGGPG